jgi:hypothetical protein
MLGLLQLEPEFLKECFPAASRIMLGRCVCRELKSRELKTFSSIEIVCRELKTFSSIEIVLSRIGIKKVDHNFLQKFPNSRFTIKSNYIWSSPTDWTKAANLFSNATSQIDKIHLNFTNESRSTQKLLSCFASKATKSLHGRIKLFDASLFCDLDSGELKKIAQALCEMSDGFENITIDLRLQASWTPASRKSLVSGIQSMPDQASIRALVVTVRSALLCCVFKATRGTCTVVLSRT